MTIIRAQGKALKLGHTGVGRELRTFQKISREKMWKAQSGGVHIAAHLYM